MEDIGSINPPDRLLICPFGICIISQQCWKIIGITFYIWHVCHHILNVFINAKYKRDVWKKQYLGNSKERKKTQSEPGINICW